MLRLTINIDYPNITGITPQYWYCHVSMISLRLILNNIEDHIEPNRKIPMNQAV